MFHTSTYIAGDWTTGAGDDRLTVQNPAAPSETLWAVPASTIDDVDDAVEAATDAQEDWRTTPPPERGASLKRAAAALEADLESVAEIQARETGKPIRNARSEVGRAVDTLRYYAELARDYDGVARPGRTTTDTVYTRHDPLGTVAVITPWNYPIAIAAWKLAPALATGNTVVQKPASACPRTNAALIEAFDAADLPSGVLNFVVGSGRTVGDRLVDHDDADGVSFTGSSEVGHHIYDTATTNGARVQCEMGGKNPLVVDDTADIDHAVALTVKSAFRNAGQLCVAVSRALVFEAVYDAYLDALEDAVSDIVIGDPLDEATVLGPKISRASMTSDRSFIEDAVAAGGRVVTGGERVEREGWYVEPTVVADVHPDDRLATEEVFGPVLAVIPVTGFEDAIAVANDVDYGLAASLCTNRLDYATEFADQVAAGMVKINETTGFAMQHPFGGWKASSTTTYREQGRAALDFFTKDKTVYLSRGPER